MFSFFYFRCIFFPLCVYCLCQLDVALCHSKECLISFTHLLGHDLRFSLTVFWSYQKKKKESNLYAFKRALCFACFGKQVKHFFWQISRRSWWNSDLFHSASKTVCFFHKGRDEKIHDSLLLLLLCHIHMLNTACAYSDLRCAFRNTCITIVIFLRMCVVRGLEL